MSVVSGIGQWAKLGTKTRFGQLFAVRLTMIHLQTCCGDKENHRSGVFLCRIFCLFRLKHLSNFLSQQIKVRTKMGGRISPMYVKHPAPTLFETFVK